ncbi:hypothetical protein [Propionivibrio soli]|uniref:hypothetical protein n=1 Tax=Propionivibrio soli TaxID=2976531 RepID=UPI003B8490E0
MARFLFLTTGFNPIRTLAARLQYFEAASGGQTRYLLPVLKLRAKSTTPSYSHRCITSICVRATGSCWTRRSVRPKRRRRRGPGAGVDLPALEHAARAAIANGAFEHGEEDIPAIVEKFYAESGETTGHGPASASAPSTKGEADGGPGRYPAERLAEKDEASVTARSNTTVTDRYASTEVSSQTRRQRLGILTSLLQRPPLATV